MHIKLCRFPFRRCCMIKTLAWVRASRCPECWPWTADCRFISWWGQFMTDDGSRWCWHTSQRWIHVYQSFVDSRNWVIKFLVLQEMEQLKTRTVTLQTSKLGYAINSHILVGLTTGMFHMVSNCFLWYCR